MTKTENYPKGHFKPNLKRKLYITEKKKNRKAIIKLGLWKVLRSRECKNTEKRIYSYFLYVHNRYKWVHEKLTIVAPYKGVDVSKNGCWSMII